MKPDFASMSRKELKAYILSHRDDLDAIDALYERRTPDSEAVWFEPPKTMEEAEQQFEVFKKMVEEREGRQDQSA
ncbi:DUF6887 family protein [Phormidesmis sp. 146-35]